MKESLAIKSPELSRQWHLSKNGDLTPDDVTTGSGKKVWWQCEKGHEWEAVVKDRSKGSACPFCSGKRACADNSLQTINPDLAKQWHPSKNEDLTPDDVTTGSGKKVWWLCEKGHEWEATVNSRAKSIGCPFCSGKRACNDNSLQTLNPDLAKQWHPSKNGDLTPDNVTTGSNKKVWWLCERGHEWKATVINRSSGNGCPFCSGSRVCAENSLQTVNPDLAKQWHPSKNKDLTPDNVTASSHKKVWWLCEKGHEWEATVNSRAKTIGCPFCSGKRACNDNSLQTLNPDLAKQWHPSKNGDLTPDDVTVGSDKRVWWQCDRGHEWEATIRSRTSGNGCPICNQGTQTSFPEQAIYFYLKNVFDDTLNRYILNNKWEIDIFVPQLFFGIEYDGIYFHQDKEIYDSDKAKYIANEGISLLRVKETERKITRCYRKNNIIYCGRRASKLQLNDIIKMSFDYVSENITYQPYFPDVDVERDRAKIYSLYMVAEEEQSLLVNYPELSKQWHPTKNLSIKPDMVKSGSNKKVWWQCEKGHEWEAIIQNRVKGDGCPFCIGKRVCADNSLQTLNPDLAKQWHPAKNGDLTPNDVTIGSSSKKIWWQCEKGHEWEALVNSRVLLNSGCPYCSGNRACDDNSLQTLNPGLAKQWHPTKNGDLTPDDVTTGSNKKVWWLCERGHEWEATVINRSSGNGCPFCSGSRVCAENSLQTVNPDLAKQWHPIKNGDLTPDDVTTGSGKRVWWKCEKGHEWEARIADRTRGRGCPYCSKLKRKN